MIKGSRFSSNVSKVKLKKKKVDEKDRYERRCWFPISAAIPFFFLLLSNTTVEIKKLLSGFDKSL